MKTKEQILSMLLALGETVEQIAAKLGSLNIKGFRRVCNTCPITEYLNEGRSGAFRVNWRSDLVIEEFANGEPRSLHVFDLEEYTTLRPVAVFINAFDNLQFPGLVKT